jgi:Acyl-CoA synthetase (NDP forming)
VQNIIAGGYKGNIYPVNPKGGKLFGLKVYSSIENVDGNVDIAIITVPAKSVFESIKCCANKGVKFAVIISSGFSEIGNTSEEKKIVSYARNHGMRILGPNIFGLYSSPVLLNATFGPKDIKPGNVSVISQSGAIGIAMIGKTKAENFGLSVIVSVGNKSDINESDILEYLIQHKETKIVMMYIEGIREGERLINALKRATAQKPVVVIKSGRSERGAMAAASHTGSLSGADEVFEDIIRQCGVLRAESIHEALEWCRFFSNAQPPEGENVVIITNGGGVGVLATDACEKYNINLYDDMEDLRGTFSELVPEFGSFRNPVDLTGQATAINYGQALTAALKNPFIHSVICLGCETAVFDANNFSEIVKKRYDDYNSLKPVVFSIFGGEKIEKCISVLKKDNIPIYREIYGAVSCLGSLYSYYRYKSFFSETTEKTRIDINEVSNIVTKVRNDNRNFLLSYEAQVIMKAAGIPTPMTRIAHNINESIKYAEEIGYPVVMKVVSKDIIHKSDIGGVIVDLDNREEVIDAYEAITYNCRTNMPKAVIEGVEIAEKVEPGIETIVGARRDESFGPVVMFGLGGIYVEVMKDISFRSFPLNRQEAMKMISEIKTYPLLLGVRGEKKKDIVAITETIIKLGTILLECKDISDIEINPLVVYDEGGGINAVDVRILFSKSQEVQ